MIPATLSRLMVGLIVGRAASRARTGAHMGGPPARSTHRFSAILRRAAQQRTLTGATGAAAHDPQMMVALLVCAYAIRVGVVARD